MARACFLSIDQQAKPSDRRSQKLKQFLKNIKTDIIVRFICNINSTLKNIIYSVHLRYHPSLFSELSDNMHISQSNRTREYRRIWRIDILFVVQMEQKFWFNLNWYLVHPPYHQSVSQCAICDDLSRFFIFFFIEICIFSLNSAWAERLHIRCHG